MATYDMQTAAGLIAQPQTSAQELADIAAQHPYLRAAVRQHPNAYPELIAWIDQTEAATHETVQPRRKRKGLVIGAIVAAAVLVGAIAVAIPVVIGGSSGSALQRSLASLEAPDGDFTLELVDAERLEEALGDPLPVDGAEGEMLDWISDAISGDRPVATNALVWQSPYTYASSPKLLSLTFAAGGQVHLFDFEELTWTRTFVDPVSAEQLDEAFGSAERGFWHDEAFTLVQDDGATYYSWTEGDLPRKRPEAAESLAADASVTQMLARLERFDAYYYVIERGALVEAGIEHSTGKRSDPIEIWGSALGMRDGRTTLTAVYDLGSREAAESNLELISEAAARSAEGADLDEPRRVYVDGRFVIAEYEVRGGNLLSIALDLRTLYRW